MNILKLNFRRKESMISSFCIKSCNKELDNEHLVFCQEINKNSEVRFENILNGSLSDKIEALQQVKLNQEKRKKEIETL